MSSHYNRKGKSKGKKKGAAAPQPQSAEELSGILAALLTDNTETIRMAERSLAEFTKTPTCVVPLMQQLMDSPHPQCRQMSAIVLRQRIVKVFRNLPAPTREEVKRSLLHRLFVETERIVRLSIAALIAWVAKVEMVKNEWTDLLTLLVAKSQSNVGDEREIALMLFRALAEDIPMELHDHFHTLKGAFISGLTCEDVKARMEAVKALVALVNLLDVEKEEEVNEFKDILPSLLNTAERAIRDGHEETVSTALDVIDKLAGTHVPLFNDVVPQTVSMMLLVVENRNFELATRGKAADFVSQLIQEFPLKTTTAKLVDPLLRVSIETMVEPFKDDPYDPDDEYIPQQLGVAIVDVVAENIPKRAFFGNVMNAISQLMHNENKHYRKGAVVLLSAIMDGCLNQLNTSAKQLIAACCQCTRDPTSLVRFHSWVTLMQFCDNYDDFMVELHSDIFPYILDALQNDECILVKDRALEVLAQLCSKFEENEIVPHTQKLVEILIGFVRNSSTLCASAVSALKSVAIASGDAFCPYFNDVMPFLKEMARSTHKDHSRLRREAIECLGSVGVAVGKKMYTAHLNEVIAIVDDVFKTKEMEEKFGLCDSAYAFFAQIAEMLGDDFSVLMKNVAIYLLASLKCTDGVNFEETDRFGGAESTNLNLSDEEYNSDSEDDEDGEELDGRNQHMSMHTGALDEVVSAIDTLAAIMKFCGKHFLPYLEKTLQELDDIRQFPHPWVRAHVLMTQTEALRLLNACFPNPQGWKRGEVSPLHDYTRKRIDTLMPNFCDRMYEEEDREVVRYACEAVYEALELFGWGVLTGKHPEVAGVQRKGKQTIYKLVVEALSVLMQEKAHCQNVHDDVGDEVVADHDETLIESVTDVVWKLAAVGGRLYEEKMKEMLPHILQFQNPKKPAYDRAMTCGCLGEIAKHYDSNSLSSILPQLLNSCLTGLNDPGVTVRRNAAFLCGSLCTNGGEVVQRGYQEFFEPLRKCFEVQIGRNEGERKDGSIIDDEYDVCEEDFLGCRDNAISAFCCMIRTNPEAVPLSDILTFILPSLPLRSDQEEAGNVYPTLINLYKTHTGIIGPHTADVIRILVGVLGNVEVHEDVQVIIVDFLRDLTKQNGPAVKEVIDKLPEEWQKRFVAFVIEEHQNGNAPNGMH